MIVAHGGTNDPLPETALTDSVGKVLVRGTSRLLLHGEPNSSKVDNGALTIVCAVDASFADTIATAQVHMRSAWTPAPDL